MKHIDKLNEYKEDGIEVVFRLVNHPNYFVTGKILEVRDATHSTFPTIERPKEFSYLLTIELENKELYYVYDYEIDSETIHPKSFQPIRFFPREPISDELREQVYKRDNYQCQLKLEGCTGKAECCDHTIPRCIGGLTTLENLKAACNHCNQKKSNKLLF
jgi:hypothetical protein